MSKYIIEINQKVVDPLWIGLTEDITAREYSSLREVITAIKAVGQMNAPLLENVIEWKSPANNSKLSIKIKEWPIYTIHRPHQIGKIKAVD